MRRCLNLLIVASVVLLFLISCSGGKDSGSTGIGQIAFSSDRDGNFQIYLMDADGSNQRNISNSASSYGDAAPAWSPDGTQIAFFSDKDDNFTFQIYVMDADGSNQRNISNSSLSDSFSNWSPDGTQIAFEGLRDDSTEIYVMDADGSNRKNISNSSQDDYYPAWKP